MNLQEIKKYEEYLNSPEYKQEQMKTFYENESVIKSLQAQNRGILSSCSDPELKEKLFKSVTEVYGEVLGADQFLFDDMCFLTIGI